MSTDAEIEEQLKGHFVKEVQSRGINWTWAYVIYRLFDAHTEIAWGQFDVRKFKATPSAVWDSLINADDETRLRIINTIFETAKS
jgi:hypothetical protein